MLTSVPNSLYAGHDWLKIPQNREDLVDFLTAHDIDANNALVASFTNKWFEVVLQVRDTEGKLVIKNNQLQTETVRKDYAVKRPKVMKEGRSFKSQQYGEDASA